MISKNIFNSDIFSGKQIYVDELKTTGNSTTFKTELNVENNAFFKSGVAIGTSLNVSGGASVSENAYFSSDTFIGNTLNVSGDTVLNGDLTVRGDTFVIETETLRIEDKNIELGTTSTGTPTDGTADGGGITLHGNTLKTIVYDNSTKSWVSSENFGTANGKYMFTDSLRARDSDGLRLTDDAGNLGIFIKDGGFVGIGTSNPNAPLDIESTNDNMIQLNQGAGAPWNYLSFSQENILKGVVGSIGSDNETLSGALSLTAYNGENLTFRTSAGVSAEAARMTILNSNGNVGIGTTSPIYTLDLYGFNKTIAVTSTHSDGTRITHASLGADVDGYGQLFINNNVGNVRSLINSNGDSYFNGGNVGIGTTNPSETLEVRTIAPAGTGAAERTAKYDGISILTEKLGFTPYNGFGGGIVFNNQTYTNGEIYSSAGIYGGIGDNATLPNIGGHLAFHTSDTRTDDPTEKMRITADGNVGIGTRNPAAELDLHGSLVFDSVNASIGLSNAGGDVNGNDLTLTTNNATNSIVARAAQKFVVQTYYSGQYNNALTVQNDGDIYLGPFGGNSPAYNKMHYIKSYNYAWPGSSVDATCSIGLGSPYQGSDDGAITFNTAMNVNTGGTVQQRMIIDTYGNVGINTSQPADKLDVNGRIAISDASIPSTTTNRLYANNGQLFWNGIRVDSPGITYSAGTALSLAGTTFNVSNDLIFSSIPTIGHSMGKIEVGNVNGIRFYTWDGVVGTSETMRLKTTGELHVDADVVAFSSTVSDKKLKDNINTINNGLDKIKKLRGVSYVWNRGARKGQTDIGVVAQEVEQVIPEVVRETIPCVGDFCENTEAYKSVDYEKLTAVLIEAVKDLSKEVDELKKKLS